ncbi:MAG: hypothetical protein NVV73_09275 [Cellvibrionaceae bacterium]|nr:hypothetical protein [Cellvibrionaceae bacterium]
MGTTSFILIIILEALALCLFLFVIASLKNRKLRLTNTELQTQLQGLRTQHMKNSHALATAPAWQTESYNDKLVAQIELTRDYHDSLGEHQNIALDLDPDTPLSRRTAAIRHAFLVAEKEATLTDLINWDLLEGRYHQILSFHKDYQNEENRTWD